MEYLIAVDLEGIGGVVGEPYKTLTDSFDYKLSTENAVKEVNAVAKALFECGATRVAVWDNHGGGANLDFSKIDSRTEKVDWRKYPYRLDFAKDYNFKGIIYLGYHAREGSFGGVLAHTFSSIGIQYVKINGAEVGELEIDSYIAATHGISPIFLASDDVCVAQFKRTSPDTVTVITKHGKGRNKADLKDEDAVLEEIYEGIKKSVSSDIKPVGISCPLTLEVRYTRAEKAEEMYAKAKDNDAMNVVYGPDTHTLFFEIKEVNRVPHVL